MEPIKSVAGQSYTLAESWGMDMTGINPVKFQAGVETLLTSQSRNINLTGTKMDQEERLKSMLKKNLLQQFKSPGKIEDLKPGQFLRLNRL